LGGRHPDAQARERARPGADRDRVELARRDLRPGARAIDEHEQVGAAALRIAGDLGEHPIVAHDGHARHARRGIQPEDDHLSRYRTTSLRDARIVMSRITASPTCCTRTRAFDDSGRRRAPSIANTSKWPPSSIGIGSKLMRPRLMLMRAIINQNESKPRFAETSASRYVISGPPSASDGVSPPRIWKNPPIIVWIVSIVRSIDLPSA